MGVKRIRSFICILTIYQPCFKELLDFYRQTIFCLQTTSTSFRRFLLVSPSRGRLNPRDEAVSDLNLYRKKGKKKYVIKKRWTIAVHSFGMKCLHKRKLKEKSAFLTTIIAMNFCYNYLLHFRVAWIIGLL